MDISYRLLRVAAYVEPCRVLADIGTDHAYIPIYLVKKQMVNLAIACDVKRGPLKRAEENIRKYGLQDRIETRLGSGFSPVLPGEADSAVLAGMGGMLMLSILEQGKKQVSSMKNLVLQPQLDAAQVRRYLHSIGFLIAQEEMLFDGGKCYSIMQAKPGEERYQTEHEYLFGKVLLDRKDTVLKRYLQEEEKRLLSISLRLSEQNTENARQKKNTLEKKMQIYREVLQCL